MQKLKIIQNIGTVSVHLYFLKTYTLMQDDSLEHIQYSATEQQLLKIWFTTDNR